MIEKLGNMKVSSGFGVVSDMECLKREIDALCFIFIRAIRKV